jgi:MFS family permease
MSALAEKVPVAIILALGLTQIIGYGTLYYSFSILAPEMARDLGWSVDAVFGIFSGSLLVGAVIAPLVGRWMDSFGASKLMAIGSPIAALTLMGCAYSFSPVTIPPVLSRSKWLLPSFFTRRLSPPWWKLHRTRLPAASPI